jgi:hypothetical protein
MRRPASQRPCRVGGDLRCAQPCSTAIMKVACLTRTPTGRARCIAPLQPSERSCVCRGAMIRIAQETWPPRWAGAMHRARRRRWPHQKSNSHHRARQVGIASGRHPDRRDNRRHPWASPRRVRPNWAGLHQEAFVEHQPSWWWRERSGRPVAPPGVRNPGLRKRSPFGAEHGRSPEHPRDRHRDRVTLTTVAVVRGALDDRRSPRGARPSAPMAMASPPPPSVVGGPKSRSLVVATWANRFSKTRRCRSVCVRREGCCRWIATNSRQPTSGGC